MRTTEWALAAAVVAVLAIPVLGAGKAPRLPRLTRWAMVVLMAVAALQLVPLPLSIVAAMSPERARLAVAAGETGWLPLCVYPAGAVFEWLRLATSVLLFLTVRELTWRLSIDDAPWSAAAGLVLVAGLEAILGLVQFYTGATGGGGAHGTYANRDHFAGLMEMALPFPVAYGTAVLRRGWYRDSSASRPALAAGLAFAAAALLLLGSIHSLSRMGFIAALFGLGVLAAFSVRQKKWLAALPVALIVLFLYLPTDDLIARFGDMSKHESLSMADRIEVWRESLPMLAVYPVAGTGLGGYEPAFMPFKRSTPMLTDNYAHNEYLHYAIELGWLGYAALCVLVASLFWAAAAAARRCPSAGWRALGAACAASMAALLLHAFVDFNTYIPVNSLAFAWVAGIASAVALEERKGEDAREAVLNQHAARRRY